jgi:hypothetical protein
MKIRVSRRLADPERSRMTRVLGRTIFSWCLYEEAVDIGAVKRFQTLVSWLVVLGHKIKS